MSKNNGSGIVWKEASRGSPCPKCGKPDWCRLDERGAGGCCKRGSAGALKERKNKNGDPFGPPRLPGRRGPPPPPEPQYKPADGEGRLADPDTLNRVYTALLKQL